jgi:hypothetical protein
MPHRPGREGEKMTPALDADALLMAQFGVRLVQESGRAQCVIAMPATALVVGDRAKFLVQDADQGVKGRRIALVESFY